MIPTYVYIDGFNLYYRALKNTPYKWVDLGALYRLLLPQNDILSIKYFTARVNDRPYDPDQSQRQDKYLRALQSCSNVEVIYGHFLSSSSRMPLANPSASGPSIVEVLKTEEKGSDVNIATHILWDAVQNKYQVAALISNDSDLVCPLQIIRSELRKTVAILNPAKSHQSTVLRANADFWKDIRLTHLQQCQLPNPLKLLNGQVLHKPLSW